MDPNQQYTGGGGWPGGAWNPAQQGYNQQNWQPQQPQQIQQPQHQQPQLPPATQYSPQPSPELFCCESCQRVAVPPTQSIHAYTTRLAFFVNHAMHPTVATYAQPHNRQLHHAFFDMLPLSTVITSTGSHGGHGQVNHIQQHQGQQRQGQQHQGQQHQGQQYKGHQQSLQQQIPTGPMNGTHYSAATTNINGDYQRGPNQHVFLHQGGYQSSDGYAQHDYQPQRASQNIASNNQHPQTVLGPIMFNGSSYGIDPSIPIPLPNFLRPISQLNVKFRLERYRLEPPIANFTYGSPALGPYQPQPPFNPPYQANTISINTNTPRARESMELIWYFWPVQLEIPLWARGQNIETSAPEIADRLVREGMQMINGERWAFIDDREDREGLWHKRRSYKVLECPVHQMLWKVTVFVRRGY
ncbi:hypothetical protein EYC80_007422 [Monilinia laxa]|uniref:Uncharacterized protein n=1 Tax=Monilinia laxa TaxID=61186 RepID=A0A5N6JUM2_MONLA|nr:hypothetical protein EYC80_007422 [Monilinia laxa]